MIRQQRRAAARKRVLVLTCDLCQERPADLLCECLDPGEKHRTCVWHFAVRT
jgi:hypothetical protein